MSRKFKIDKEPYDEGVKIYNKSVIEIQSGVTVLVGCNGAGKTTLLREIKRQLEKDKIPCLFFDNYHDGGYNMVSKAIFNSDISLAGTAMYSSEGERIMCFAQNMSREIGHYSRKYPDGDELWILIDAIDSGWSIDYIEDVKEYLFKTIIESENREVYIVVSANEYELCRNNSCFDVINCKYRVFKTYDSYRKFILKSREQKDKRYNIN